MKMIEEDPDDIYPGSKHLDCSCSVHLALGRILFEIFDLFGNNPIPLTKLMSLPMCRIWFNGGYFYETESELRKHIS